MKVITSHISDTHNQFDVETGEGNILFHHGDAADVRKVSDLVHLNNFFTQQLNNFDNVVFTPGNHDIFFEFKKDEALAMIDSHGGRVKVLINEGTELFGLKIYCSPLTLVYGMGFAFMKNSQDIVEDWKNIPSDTQLLITHGPPYGILDYIPGRGHQGDSQLAYWVEKLPNLKLHGFGHIHEGNGVTEKKGVTYLNAAVAGDYMRGPFDAWIVNWEDGNVLTVERVKE